MKKTYVYLLALMATASLSACGHKQPTPKPELKTIADIVTERAAADKPEFSTLLAAVRAAGLVETLNGADNFTVFAPTDAAFKKLSKEKLDDLLKPENKGKLKSILQYHLVKGKTLSEEIVNLKKVKTVEGSEIEISVKNKDVYLNKDVKVTPLDIKAKNGVIHVIDTVLMPPTEKPKN